MASPEQTLSGTRYCEVPKIEKKYSQKLENTFKDLIKKSTILSKLMQTLYVTNQELLLLVILSILFTKNLPDMKPWCGSLSAKRIQICALTFTQPNTIKSLPLWKLCLLSDVSEML